MINHGYRQDTDKRKKPHLFDPDMKLSAGWPAAGSWYHRLCAATETDAVMRRPSPSPSPRTMAAEDCCASFSILACAINQEMLGEMRP